MPYFIRNVRRGRPGWTISPNVMGVTFGDVYENDSEFPLYRGTVENCKGWIEANDR